MAKNKSILNNLFGSSVKVKADDLQIAHKKAEKIVADAVSKAGQILEQTIFIDKNLKDELEIELKGAVAEAVETVRIQTNQLVSSSLGEFASGLKKALVDSAKSFSDELTQKQKKVDEELVVYKKQKMQEFDNLVIQRVNELSKQVLGKSLSSTDHQELVKNAINRAKEEKILS